MEFKKKIIQNSAYQKSIQTTVKTDLKDMKQFIHQQLLTEICSIKIGNYSIVSNEKIFKQYTVYMDRKTPLIIGLPFLWTLQIDDNGTCIGQALAEKIGKKQ